MPIDGLPENNDIHWHVHIGSSSSLKKCPGLVDLLNAFALPFYLATKLLRHTCISEYIINITTPVRIPTLSKCPTLSVFFHCPARYASVMQPPGIFHTKTDKTKRGFQKYKGGGCGYTRQCVCTKTNAWNSKMLGPAVILTWSPVKIWFEGNHGLCHSRLPCFCVKCTGKIRCPHYTGMHQTSYKKLYTYGEKLYPMLDFLRKYPKKPWYSSSKQQISSWEKTCCQGLCLPLC